VRNKMHDLNGIEIKNRVIIGSGPAKYGRGYEVYENPISYLLFKFGFINPGEYGGVDTKTLTMLRNIGNYRWYTPWKVLRKVPGGWINRFGWNNCGISTFVEKEFHRYKHDNLIPSIGAFESPTELLYMIECLNFLNILAIEMNISCPHVDILFRDDFKKLESFLHDARKLSRHSLILKLGADETTVVKAKMAQECGINAISAINTVPVYVPGFGYAGKSGPQIKPIALETVFKIASEVSIPVIGGGGIQSISDAREFLDAGAQAVSVVTLFFNPLKAIKFPRQIREL